MSGTNETTSDPLRFAPVPESAAQSGSSDHVPATWVAQHWDAVYKLLYRFSSNPHEAEDLSQETFLRAIERQSSFKPGTNRRAWLLRIATNAFLDRQRRKKILKIGPISGDMADHSPHAGEPMQKKEMHEQVLAAIATLPETARVVFLLRGEQQLPFREIAQIIDASEETARWHMMQARKALLAKLDGKLD